jgi:peptidoglycan/LPS O-acetylase OafA/YrhL
VSLPTLDDPVPERRIDDIEILRAVAVSLVIVQHAGDNVQWALLPKLIYNFDFAAGVDLFFVISGFVIARGLLPAMAAAPDWRGRMGVMKRFWIRRIWRIWPAAWLWLGLILLGGALCDPSVFGSLSTNAWATLAGVLNYANVRFAHMFGGHFFYGASFAYWSLSSEEQFYALLPILALAIRPLLTPVALAIMALHVRYNNPIFFPLMRSAELFYGVLLAQFAATPYWPIVAPEILRRHGWLRAAVTLLLLLLFLRAGSNVAHTPYRYSVMAVIAVVIVWIASYGKGFLYTPSFAKPALLWLGSRSFALYLIHVPIWLALAAISRAWPLQGGSHLLNQMLTPVALCLMLILADLTNRLVERPLRDYGKRLTQPVPN